MPSTTGPGSAPSAIPGPNTTTKPCDRSVTATAAPCAASPIASSPCSLPCSVTKPSMTKPGLTPHDPKLPSTNGGESRREEARAAGTERRSGIAPPGADPAQRAERRLRLQESFFGELLTVHAVAGPGDGGEALLAH